MVQYSFEEFGLREETSEALQVTDDLIRIFAEITNDLNPIHLDDESARKSGYDKRIAHGIIGASLISSVIGNKMPGVGSVYVSQTLIFRAPVFPGDYIYATVTPLKFLGKQKCIFNNVVKTTDGRVIIKGESVVFHPRFPKGC
jgi:3-hydroxybutyryl-CoA dehydratase